MMRLPYFAFHAPRTVGEAADLVVHSVAEAKSLVAKITHQLGVEVFLRRIDMPDGFEK